MSTSTWVPMASGDAERAVKVHLGASPLTDGAGQADLGAPQAFLVHRSNSAGRLRVHWHPVAQFQYFVAGEARMQGHDVVPGLLHYADSHTPYGPLDVGPVGVSFLTLRAYGDQGANFMPESQAALATRTHGSRRNLTFDLRAVEAGAVRYDDDGLGIEVIDVVPGGSAIVDPVMAVAYVVVVDGTIVSEHGDVDAGSFALVHGRERVHAGRSGARIAVLRFPNR